MRVREFGNTNIRMVPLDAPYPDPRKGGRKRLPDATRWMRVVIKLRQDIETDFLFSEGEKFDHLELRKRWYPKVTGYICVKHKGKYYP